MNKYKKNDILKAIQKLVKMNDIIDNEITMSIPEIIGKLQECQEIAIQIGNYLESLDMQTNSIVSILEEYCEDLYQLCLAITDGLEYGRIVNKIQRELTQIHDEICCILPTDKKEIVFFPYNVSMWDSMESIWRAASEDDIFEVVVVPIPYFEKNPDGTLGQMHYDNSELPKYVPTISWKEYNIEKSRPEIAFVHNPYDEYNYVTSVHPLFYSRHIKKYVKTLVYIPYYFTNRELPSEHLKLPVYQYADYIIAQNYIVKEQLNKVLPKDKVLALGSPKLDRLLYFEKNKKIPLELLDFIGDRKVILMNTSISSILKYNESVLKKIAYLIDTVECRDDIVLIWRPHPLLESTLKSMRMHLMRPYEILKKKYIASKCGLFDYGMDLDMVVSLADAYIGEESSSIVTMFASLGKPIYTLNFEIDLIFNNKYFEPFFDFYKKGDQIFFAHSEMAAFCKSDYNSGLVDTVISLEKENIIGSRKYTEIVEKNCELYLTPMNSNKCVKINHETNELNSFDIEQSNYPNYNRALKYKDFLIFVPTTNNLVIKYNCITGKKICYDAPIRKIKQFGKEEGYHCMFASCIVKDCLYMATPTSNYIIEFNLLSEELHSYYIGETNSGYWDMIYDGKDFWLNPYKGSTIIRWNKETNSVYKYNQYPKGFKIPDDKKDCFIRLVDCDNTILAFPKRSNMIIEINKTNGNIKELILNLPYREGERKNDNYTWESNYYFAKRIENKVYAMSAFEHDLLEIDFRTGTYKSRKFEIPKDKYKKLKNSCFENNMWGTKIEDFIFKESNLISVTDFIEAIKKDKLGINRKEKDIFLETVANANGSSGEKIYQFFKRLKKI